MHPLHVGELAARLTGLSELYQDDGRRRCAGINSLTTHDGFSFDDFVSYSDKHEEANGEDGDDGHSHSRSWNCGASSERRLP